MSKDYESVSSHEFMRGLEELEQQGVKLPKNKNELLTEVVSNTHRQYHSKLQGIGEQPINVNELSRNIKKKNSQILRENMINAGRSLPKGTDAYHIVPASENRSWAKDYAQAARAILRRWGISINHEANGVALPSSSKRPVKSLPNAYPHKQVHTKVYYLNVVD
ncbi:MAG: AHH domain-containing protein [Endozoicomonas sp.]|uniref:AHH domain-containing protein n=1 Tax=Endozoicomonas sp. TaxID=1892382 RepID=UPI003D9BD3B7